MPERPSEPEEQYFKQREIEQRQEMRERLSKQASELDKRRKIAADTGATIELAERIEGLGFNEETAAVFDLLPVIWVAWADGSVTGAERAAILGMLDERHIKVDTPAFKLVETLLEEKPTPEYLEGALDVMRDLFKGKEVESWNLIDMCAEVAQASGGFLGLFGDKVSKAEHDLIEKIASSLGKTAVSALHEKL